MSLLDEDRDSLSNAEYEQLVTRLTLEELPVENDSITAVISEIDAITRTGKAVLRKFEIVDEEGVLEYVEETPNANVHGLLSTTAFLEDFLRSPELNEAIPELNTENGFSGYHWYSDTNHRSRATDDSQTFDSYHPVFVDGYLAWLLIRGGAYESFSGTDATAKALGRQFTDAVIGGRYEQITGYRLEEIQWSEWFDGIPHWDETLILVDSEKSLLWLFMFTSTS